MRSLLVEAVGRPRARGLRRIGAFVVGACMIKACLAVCADGSAFAQTSGKIPELAANPSDWAWVRIRPRAARADPERP
jgi:hypothetical protein